MKLLQNLTEVKYQPNKPEKLATGIIRKIVRKAVNDHGWEIWDSRTDKIKDGRRLSFWRNGWKLPERMKNAILVQIQRDMQRGRIQGEVSWHTAMRGGYGTYDKLIVKVPHKDTMEDTQSRELKNELARLRKKGPHKRGTPELNRIAEIMRLLGRPLSTYAD